MDPMKRGFIRAQVRFAKNLLARYGGPGVMTRHGVMTEHDILRLPANDIVVVSNGTSGGSRFLMNVSIIGSADVVGP